MRAAVPWLQMAALLLAATVLAGCIQGGSSSPPAAGTGVTDTDDPGLDIVSKKDAADTTTTAGDEQVGPDADSATEQPDTYEGPACTTTAACKNEANAPFCAISLKQCVQCLFDSHCVDTGHCEKNKCIVFACKPTETSCDGLFLVTCNADGKSTTTEKCPDEKPTCVGGSCKSCEPGSTFCEPGQTGLPSKNLRKCDATGDSSTIIEACAGEAVCQNKKCLVCVPGTKQCNGDVAMACSNDGNAMDVEEDCSKKGLTCLGGLCVNACAGDVKSNTYVGCDFWAVDLDNAIEGSYDAQNKQFAVVVSNTSDNPATVSVSLGKEATPKFKKKDFTVPGKGLQVINLPDKSWGVANQNQDGSTINEMVYRIKATQPIVAYQFNPLDNAGVFSNDASLLLPTTALGENYYILTRKQLANKYRSYLNVIATQPGDTKVKVTATCKTLGSPSVPVMQPKVPANFVLQQGQALNIESDDPLNGDLSGTLVEADRPVAVFGGSEASNSPDTGSCVQYSKGGKICASSSNGLVPQTCAADTGCTSACCADHLEEQMFPINTLGTSYVGTRLSPRGKELDAWRILAVQDGTTINVKPYIGSAIPVLNKGQWHEFQTDKDFILTATKPVLVAQYMASSYATVVTEGGTCTTGDQCKSKYGFVGNCVPAGISSLCAPIGDPSLILGVATSQFLDDYIFLVPDKYKLNFVNVVMPTDALALLDGKAVTAASFTPIMNSGWQVARLAMPAGAHRLQLTKKGGLVVYGYDKDVSYGYAGGAGLAVGN
ncbi:MAG: hypothetical protein EXR77_03280 [Myxococcales bacterium]|nr:hypothetical protein [Myxococcales bacterium]